MNRTTEIEDLIDIDRYPVNDRASDRATAMLARAREALQRDGACMFPSFLRPAAVDAAIRAAHRGAGDAFRTAMLHDIDFSGVTEAELPSSSPHRFRLRTAKSGKAYDRITTDSPLRRFYESEDVTAFVGSALGIEPLFRMDDPLGALNVMYYEPGDELGWHFDRSEFAVTLLLQAPCAGGVFEYVPMLRSEHDQNDAGVVALLERRHEAMAHVRSMGAEPGTLVLFRGHWSPHRVTPVIGPQARINAVLSYARTPGHWLKAEGRRLFYGRA